MGLLDEYLAGGRRGLLNAPPATTPLPPEQPPAPMFVPTFANGSPADMIQRANLMLAAQGNRPGGLNAADAVAARIAPFGMARQVSLDHDPSRDTAEEREMRQTLAAIQAQPQRSWGEIGHGALKTLGAIPRAAVELSRKALSPDLADVGALGDSVRQTLWNIATIPQRAIEGAQYDLATGDPTFAIAPATDAALLTMGATPFGVSAVRSGEAVLGAGPIRRSNPPMDPNSPFGASLPERQAARELPAKSSSPATEVAAPTTGHSNIPNPAQEAPPFEAMMPELAGGYPKTAPPILKTDSTGKQYWAKQLSPVELRLQAVRRAIQRDIDAGNYTPEFDPALRYPADRTHYPRTEDTRNIKAVRASTQAKHDAIARSPEATQRLDGTFDRGLEQEEDARYWHDMGQLEDAFIAKFGPEEGRTHFKSRFAEAVAATSAGANPEANLLMAHYANYLRVNGLNMPTAAYQVPHPVGARWLVPNFNQYKKLLMDSSGITSANPKRYDYSNSFLGHTSRRPWPSNDGPPLEGGGYDGGPPVDEQRFRLMDPGRSAPPPGTYGHYKQALIDRAAARGASPTFFGDMLYAGARADHRTKPMITLVNEMLERTRRVYGLSREAVLDGFLTGKIPMVGIAGTLLGGQSSKDDDVN